jgi:hypothetical protein
MATISCAAVGVALFSRVCENFGRSDILQNASVIEDFKNKIPPYFTDIK